MPEPPGNKSIRLGLGMPGSHKTTPANPKPSGVDVFLSFHICRQCRVSIRGCLLANQFSQKKVT